MDEKAKSTLSDILEQRNQSRQWRESNYDKEFEDVYRLLKCKTQPIMVKNSLGQEVEDKTRTNVCMPVASLIARRKTARLTAQHPQINYTGPEGSSSLIPEKLTALANLQFDRSGESSEHEKVVQSAIVFGRGISKVFEDKIEVMRRKRVRLIQDGIVQYRDRESILRTMGMSDEQIQANMQMGPEMSDDEVAQAASEIGDDVIEIQENTKKYEGPVVKHVFIGDFYDEPGCKDLNSSGWAIEEYNETDLWLQKKARETYIDPETGEEKPVFDVDAIEELMSQDMPASANSQMQPSTLRDRLRTSNNQTTPQFPSRLLPGKRFQILERHQRDKFGQFWITYVGNEKVVLGKKPYPWDLYGRYVYTEMVLLPDLLNAIGDSTIRLMRWLFHLHNATVGDRKDLVRQILKPIMKLRVGEDLPDEVIDRLLYRVIRMKDVNAIQPMAEPASIGAALTSANEEEGQLLRMIQIGDPDFMSVDQGTESNPMAGKLATTAILSAKSADSLTQYELNGIAKYLKDLGEKKLWINQQSAQDIWNIPSKYVVTSGLKEQLKATGLSDRGGQTAAITLDPMEIQEDYQVEPEVYSILSIDDEIRKNTAVQLNQFAAADPITWNKRYAAEVLCRTMRGVDPEKAINPPAPAAPPAPKFNISVAVKWPELPPEIQAQLLGAAGAEVSPEVQEELNLEQSLQGVTKLSEAANAAENLASDGTEEAEVKVGESD